MVMELEYGHLHIWHANIALQKCFPSAVEKILSPDERDRAARFRFNIHRVRYIFAHASLRLLISDYLTIEPDAIIFRIGPYGKPFLLTHQAEFNFSQQKLLEFNISHSADAVVFAFAWNTEIGIDTELINPNLHISEIASTVFTPNELSGLYALPAADQHRRFFELWSRKEAYAKALGMGLHLPFNELEIGLEPVVNGLHIHSFQPAPGYAAAVAVPSHLTGIRHFEFQIASFLSSAENEKGLQE